MSQYIRYPSSGLNPSGAVVGPSSSVDGSIALFDGVTGKLLKDSVLTVVGQTISGPAGTGVGNNEFPITIQPGDTPGGSGDGNDLNLFAGDNSASNNPGNVNIQSFSSGGNFYGNVNINAAILSLFSASIGGYADFNGGNIINVGSITLTGGVSTTTYRAGTSGATKTIDFNNGANQELSITADCTLTLSNPVSGTVYVLKFTQDITGGWTYTWPVTVLWPGGTAPVGSAANKVDIITLFYDGTNYYGTFGLNY